MRPQPLIVAVVIAVLSADLGSSVSLSVDGEPSSLTQQSRASSRTTKASPAIGSVQASRLLLKRRFRAFGRFPACSRCLFGRDCGSGICRSFFGGGFRCGGLRAQIRAGCLFSPRRDKDPDCTLCLRNSQCSSGICTRAPGGLMRCGDQEAQIAGNCATAPATEAPRKKTDCSLCDNRSQCASGTCRSFFGGPSRCGDKDSQITGECASAPTKKPSPPKEADCSLCSRSTMCISGFCRSYFGGASRCGDRSAQIAGGCTTTSTTLPSPTKRPRTTRPRRTTRPPPPTKEPVITRPARMKKLDCDNCVRGAECTSGACESVSGGGLRCGSPSAQILGGCASDPTQPTTKREECEVCLISSECISDICSITSGGGFRCGSRAAQMAAGCA